MVHITSSFFFASLLAGPVLTAPLFFPHNSARSSHREIADHEIAAREPKWSPSANNKTAHDVLNEKPKYTGVVTIKSSKVRRDVDEILAREPKWSPSANNKTAHDVLNEKPKYTGIVTIKSSKGSRDVGVEELDMRSLEELDARDAEDLEELVTRSADDELDLLN